MCLFTKQKESFIAQEYIVIVKVLRWTSEGYKTYYIGKPVLLNNYLVPDSDVVIRDSRVHNYHMKHYIIKEGAIHSCIGIPRFSFDFEPYMFISIIPKGCKYWVGIDEDECCSETLLITSIPAKITSSLTELESDFNNPESKLYKKYKDLLENPKYNKQCV